MSILSRSVSGLRPVPSSTSRSVQTPPASETATLRDDDPSTSSGNGFADIADSSANGSEDESSPASLLDILNEVKSKPHCAYLSLFQSIEPVAVDESGLGADQIAQAYKKI